MKKINVEMEITEKRVTKREVALPFLRLHHAGDEHAYDVYTLVTEEKVAHEIVVTENEVKVEMRFPYHFRESSDENYLLGRGAYACSAKQFEMALLLLEEKVRRMRTEFDRAKADLE